MYISEFRILKSGRGTLWFNFAIIVLLLAAIIFGSIFYFIIIKNVFGEVKLSPWAFLLKCLIIYILSVFLHEMGHLVMVKRNGYRFRIFKSGGITAMNNSFRNISFQPWQLLSGGFVMMNFNEAITTQSSYEKFIMKDYFFISIGGMLSNILLAAIGIMMMLTRFTIEWGYILAFFNVLILLAQLCHPSDLTRLWFIRKHSQKGAVLFSEELSINVKVNSFLEEVFRSYIERTLLSKVIDQHLFIILKRMIEYNLINGIETSKEMLHFIDWFNDHFDSIKKMGIGIRLAADGLMYTLNEYGLAKSGELMNSKLSRRHPFHHYYMHFSCYQEKLAALEAIKEEGR